MLKIVAGDLMKATEMYICHQCNCVTNRSAYLAHTMFKCFPYADIYSGRKYPDTPGTIKICGNGDDERFIINMLGQYYPGKKYRDSKKDGEKTREKYFSLCLDRLEALCEGSGEGSFAFPWRIGCGAAGGEWDNYMAMLEAFSRRITTDVVIYRLPSKEPKTPCIDRSLFP